MTHIVKLSAIAILAMIMSCTVTEPATPDTDSPDTATVEIPEALRAVPLAVSCSSEGDACIPVNLCIGEHGHTVFGTGCGSGTVCCSFRSQPLCSEENGVCTASGICRGNGGRAVFGTGCSSTQVCCVF